MIVAKIMIGLFIVTGIFLINGKGSFLISGYNMLPKEDKEQYDTVALCKFMGKMMFAISLSVLLWVLSDIYGRDWLFVLGMVLFVAIVIFMLVYMNTGNRFKK
ncbi:DUF3784 domain-containing protein [Oceanobacillus locisalsi]|uniref:DUF3784 domain-containing protein n=1 Tax=Oceanobacillus locisalsi TaxID=546107 RepID=A0ABW3NME1_9BACI